MMELDRITKFILVYRLFWGVCLALVVINAYLFFVTLAGQQTTLESLYTQYRDLRSKGAMQSTGVASRFEISRQDIERFRADLPSMETVPGRIRELHQLLKAHTGGKTSGMTFQSKWDENLGLWRYATTVKVRNTYAEVKRLLADLQDAPGLFCIEKMNLRRTKPAGWVELDLHLATYCR